MRRKNNFVTYPETKEAGVYAIVNKTRKKVYIGESQNIRSRAKAHINLLKSGKHYCEELQKDYDNNHKMEIVEVYIVSNLTIVIHGSAWRIFILRVFGKRGLNYITILEIRIAKIIFLSMHLALIKMFIIFYEK